MRLNLDYQMRNKILNARKIVLTAETFATENEIDFFVYKLYSLTCDEVLIIDSKTSITKQQYEQ